MSKRRLKSEPSDKENGGGKMYLMAGLVSLVAVGYFVYQVLASDDFKYVWVINRFL